MSENSWWDDVKDFAGQWLDVRQSFPSSAIEFFLRDKEEEEEQLEVPEGRDITSDPTITKTLHWQQSGPDAAFATFINWMFRNGINMLTPQATDPAGGVMPAAEQVRTALAPRGGRLGGDEKAQAQLINLRDGAQRGEAIAFLGDMEVTELRDRTLQLANARIQEIYDHMVGQTSGVSSDWMRSLPPDAITGQPSQGSERHREWVKNVIENFNLDRMSEDQRTKFLSEDTINKVLMNLHESAANDFLVEFSETSPLMMLGGQWDPAIGKAQQYGFINSYNGTPFGQIDTVYDLFSGGQIGPYNVAPLLAKVYEDTRDSSGYSSVLNRIQSELYAWGFIDEVQNWGYLEPVREGPNATVDGLQMFQTEIINVAMEEQIRLGEDEYISADNTPRVDDVIHTMISNRMSGGPTMMASEIEHRLINRIAEKIDNSPWGASDQTKHEITNLIREMDPRRQEALFGEGGSAQEVRLMDAMLSSFYGTNQWDALLDFNSDTPNGMRDNFLKYAGRVGAVPSNMDNPTQQDKADVSRAVLRQIIARDVEDLSMITEEQIANALTIYGETPGLKNNVVGGGKFVREDYERMARDAYGNWSGVRYEADPNERLLEIRAQGEAFGSSDRRALTDAIRSLSSAGSNRVRV